MKSSYYAEHVVGSVIICNTRLMHSPLVLLFVNFVLSQLQSDLLNYCVHIKHCRCFHSLTKWTTVRRVSLKNASVQFGGPMLRFTPLGTGSTSTVVSREINTAKLPIPAPAAVTTQSITTTTTDAPPSELEKIEEVVLNNIINDSRLSSVYNLVRLARLELSAVAISSTKMLGCVSGRER